MPGARRPTGIVGPLLPALRALAPAPRRWRALALAATALAVLLTAAGTTQAARISERSRQKQAAETERAALRDRLAALKREIDRTETARGQAADALAASEAAISEARLSLRELAQEQTQAAARLDALTREQAALQKTAASLQNRLSRMLRDQYVAGREDRMKLLLSGDNPNRINRELQYMGYVSRAQAQLLESLRQSLAAVERNQAEVRDAKEDLDDIARDESRQKEVLEREKARRAALLVQLSGKLAAQRREAGGIERDEKRLSALVDRLASLIEEQRRAELEQQARRRQELAAQAARKRAEQQRAREALARRDGRNGPPPTKNPDKAEAGLMQHNPDAIDADENPNEVLARNELAPRPDVQSRVFPASFPALRGQLRLPVKGELLARYGSRRGDGPAWKGLFIRAPEGSEVRAVAGGRVVFADWLRGFGNLVIVDHGGQYLTIYGNNQAVLKRAGDAVLAGEVIASAGNSGGNEQSGLYFEMRYQGRAFDPLGWVALK